MLLQYTGSCGRNSFARCNALLANALLQQPSLK
jgi:hypothetical protein